MWAAVDHEPFVAAVAPELRRRLGDGARGDRDDAVRAVQRREMPRRSRSGR